MYSYVSLIRTTQLFTQKLTGSFWPLETVGQPSISRKYQYDKITTKCPLWEIISFFFFLLFSNDLTHVFHKFASVTDNEIAILLSDKESMNAKRMTKATIAIFNSVKTCNTHIVISGCYNASKTWPIWRVDSPFVLVLWYIIKQLLHLPS